METSINRDQLKDLIKAAVTEALEEQRALIHEAVEEALEDVALARAIEEGEGTELIDRQEVFKLLEGEA
jgi:DNA polymerase III alpha subunit